MNRLSKVWVPRPEEDDDQQNPYVIFRITDNWLFTDSDQLFLPISLLERNGEQVENGGQEVLAQYGGEELLNDLLLADQDLEKGSTWILQRTLGQLSVEPHEVS